MVYTGYGWIFAVLLLVTMVTIATKMSQVQSLSTSHKYVTRLCNSEGPKKAHTIIIYSFDSIFKPRNKIFLDLCIEVLDIGQGMPN